MASASSSRGAERALTASARASKPFPGYYLIELETIFEVDTRRLVMINTEVLVGYARKIITQLHPGISRQAISD